MFDDRSTLSSWTNSDDDRQVDRLLACHPFRDTDPERHWAGPLPMGLPAIAFERLSRRLGDLLIATALVLARAARPEEPGWAALEDTIPTEPAAQPDEPDHQDLDRAA